MRGQQTHLFMLLSSLLVTPIQELHDWVPHCALQRYKRSLQARLLFSLGMAPVLIPLRPSSEHILIVRAPGARDQRGCHSIPLIVRPLRANEAHHTALTTPPLGDRSQSDAPRSICRVLPDIRRSQPRRMDRSSRCEESPPTTRRRDRRPHRRGRWPSL
jgi:hypothetical protein